MLNKTLKRVAAVLISLTLLAGSMPSVVAAEITESAPVQTEHVVPMQTEPIVTETVVSEPVMTEPVAVEPVATEPAVTEPVPKDTTLPSGSAVTEPSVTDPAVTDQTLPDEETDLPLTDNDGALKPIFAVQWGMLPMYAGSNGVFRWSIAPENGGYYIYAVTNMYESASFTVMYEDGGEELLRYEANTQPVVLDSLWNPILGGYVQSYVENNTRYSEIYIPQSFFKDLAFTIICGQAVNSLDITNSSDASAIPNYRDTAETPGEQVADYAYDDTAIIVEEDSVQGEIAEEPIEPIEPISSGTAYAGIAIDGSYQDWKYYPHSSLQYDEYAEYAGGAIYNNGDGYVYGHTVAVATDYQNPEIGGIWQFCMSVNGTDNVDLTAVLICEGADGRLHFAAEADYAQNMNDIGVAHKYYIVDADYTGSIEGITVDELAAFGQLYGEAYVTKSPSQWDMEYMVSIEMLAEKAGLGGASDVKTISSRFQRLGGQWVTTAGTSTGTFWGIFLCLATVTGTFFFKKKKAMGTNE